jgi:DNA-binding CsgD family transcriptional regulator
MGQCAAMDERAGQDSILRAVRGVSMVEELNDFGPAVLEQVDALIPSDLASFNEVDPLAERAVVVARPYGITPDQLEVWQRWAHQNPALMHVLRTGDGSARRLSDFLTLDELHQLDLYRYVYGPLGVEYQLSTALPAPRPTVLGIALNRHGNDFSDAEVALLDALRPHLVQAYRHAQLITEHRRALEGVAGALEQEGRAFLVIGQRVLGPGLAMLARHFGPSRDRLPGPVQAWLDDERASFGASGPDRLRQPLVSVCDGRRLTLRFVPGGRGPDLLWMVELPAEPDATPLQRLGLSPREAEVLWLLTKGRRSDEIARDLGVAAGTVKKHLEHVYRKLGVSNATAAVAQAFDALAAR